MGERCLSLSSPSTGLCTGSPNRTRFRWIRCPLPDPLGRRTPNRRVRAFATRRVSGFGAAASVPPEQPHRVADPIPEQQPVAARASRKLPVPPPFNLGRRLRALAGVDEKLMAYVPQEKAWYTSLGGVVLGTATIAAFSMWFAITQALGVTSYWAIFAVIVWFFFILSVDRWLVSGRLTGDLRKRVPV